MGGRYMGGLFPSLAYGLVEVAVRKRLFKMIDSIIEHTATSLKTQ